MTEPIPPGQQPYPHLDSRQPRTTPYPHPQPSPPPQQPILPRTYRHARPLKPPVAWWANPWLIVPSIATLVLVAFIVVTNVQARSDAGESVKLPAQATAPTIDGDVEFRITHVQAGIEKLDGNEVVGTSQFIVVTVDMRNLGSRSNRVFITDQDLVDKQGKSYDTADITGKLNDMIFGPDLQPGEARSIRLAFVVPNQFDLGSLIVRDASSSPGVTIPLT